MSTAFTTAFIIAGLAAITAYGSHNFLAAAAVAVIATLAVVWLSRRDPS